MPPPTSRNLADGLSEQAGLRPAAPALALPGGVLSFAQIEALVWSGCARLAALGIRSGDVVGLACVGEANLIVALLACARIGATAIALPQTLPAILRSATARAAGVRFQLTERPADSGEQAFDIADLLRNPAPPSDVLRAEDPRAPWLIISGSGSTGKSKLIPVGHAQFAGRMRIYNTALGIAPGDRVASLFALDYATPKQRCLEALFAGATVVLLDRQRGELPRRIHETGITVLYATVLDAERLLQSLPPDAEQALPSLRCLMVGSSVVGPGLRERIRQRLTGNLFVYYGMNEFGLCSLVVPGADTLPGSVGQVPPGVSVEVVDGNGQPLPPGSVGHVRGRSPGMCAGYLDDPEASRRAFRDGWFHPGDLARFAPDGQLVFCGRSDDMMNMNGINIYPAEIECVLAEHTAVREVVAFPLHHPIHQDVPACAVTLRPAAAVDEDELLEFAAERLGAHAPRRIVTLPALPRNEQGKLIRGQLMQQVGAALGIPVIPRR